MAELLTEKFEVNPITLKGKKLTVHLDNLNKAIEPYNLRVEALDDITIDPDFPEGNVLKILTVYTKADEDWSSETENWFFKELKDMEDKFEASSDVVAAADYDRGNKILMLTLNKKGVELVKTFEKGGAFQQGEGDAGLVHEVDGYLTNKPKDVFAMLGIEMPEDPAKVDAMLKDVRSKAVEHLKTTRPAPVKIFFQGKKMDLSTGTSEEALYLQQAFYDKLVEYANQHLNGHDNPAYAREFAANKSTIAMDCVLGMAQQKKLPVFIVDDAIIDEVMNRITQQSPHQK